MSRPKVRLIEIQYKGYGSQLVSVSADATVQQVFESYQPGNWHYDKIAATLRHESETRASIAEFGETVTDGYFLHFTPIETPSIQTPSA